MAPEAISMPLTPASSEDQELVRNYIDGVLVDILHQLTLSPSDGQPSITLRRRPRQATCKINLHNGALEAGCDNGTYRSYSWPGSTAKESWKFGKETYFRDILASQVSAHGGANFHDHIAVIIRVLGIIDQALRAGQLVSKRLVVCLGRCERSR